MWCHLIDMPHMPSTHNYTLAALCLDDGLAPKPVVSYLNCLGNHTSRDLTLHEVSMQKTCTLQNSFTKLVVLDIIIICFINYCPFLVSIVSDGCVRLLCIYLCLLVVEVLLFCRTAALICWVNWTNILSCFFLLLIRSGFSDLGGLNTWIMIKVCIIELHGID